MKTTALLLALCALSCCDVTSGSAPQSRLTGCQTSAECGPGRCCVLVEGRYPTTSCESRRRPGDQCRPPSDQPLDTTLSFPGGASVAVRGVHRNLCPCEESSACSAQGMCVSRDRNFVV